MDALVMCGGRGSRMAAVREKPLVRVAGRPSVHRVTDALRAADRVNRVTLVASPNAPDTRAAVADRSRSFPDCRVVETAGDGYVADLREALATVGRPVVTAAADVPALAGPLVDRLLARADGATTVVVPARLKRLLGASVDERPYGTRPGRDGSDASDAADDPDAPDERNTPDESNASGDPTAPDTPDAPGDAERAVGWVPTGLNVVGEGEDSPLRTWDARLAVNLNYASDVRVAERLLGAAEAGEPTASEPDDAARRTGGDES